MLAVGALAVLCCSSSSAAIFMMSGDDDSSTTRSPGPTGPARPPGPAPPSGTTFHRSTLPPADQATILDPGQLIWGKNYYVPESMGSSAPWYLQLQTDGNVVWVKRGAGTQWSLASHTTMPGTNAYLQGDGNLCAYGNGGTACTLSHDPNVPAGQHKLVLKSNGELYVDHGTGESGRSYIHRP